MALVSILALSAIAQLLPAQTAAAEQKLRGGQTSSGWQAPNQKLFEAAISLEDFKNVDPEHFEWINPNEIAPGETTCGFLKASLGWEVEELDVTYPTVETYVCVYFAKKQPALNGNLAVHCGGPESVSGCAVDFAHQILKDDETLSLYNIIAFDQRGMGVSKPTFIVPECDVKYPVINFDDEASIRGAAKVYKDMHLKCWNHPEFKLEALQMDGSTRQFHFLEYSGTRQLAEDIERVRILFGNQKLSIFGISYGTTVMGTYATVFSKNVNLMVLDGSVDPDSDIESFSIDSARFRQDRLDYFIASCEFGNFNCGVHDVRTCINDVNEMVNLIEENNQFADDHLLSNAGDEMGRILEEMYADYDSIETLCDVAKDHDVESFKAWLREHARPEEQLWLQKPDYPEGFFSPWGPSGPTFIASGCLTCVHMVFGQDKAFGAYDEDRYVNFLQQMNKEYPGMGTQQPAKRAEFPYSTTYYWPNITPLAPIGNPFLSGIIAGQLWDPATPYIWTQKMREHFKSATLLTSRSVNHGIMSAIESAVESQTKDHECFDNILRYLKTGNIDFTDGKVCESDNALTGCTIDSILNGGGCKKPPAQLPLAAE